MFVIMKGCRYVAIPGRMRSYTTSLQYARVYATRADADANRCGDERIVPVSSILKPIEGRT